MAGVDLNIKIGADIQQFKAAMAAAGQTAQQTSKQIQQALAEAAKQSEALGGSAQSASMKMMQMRSGISAARDGVLAFTVGGQAAERSLLAMGHHINSLVNETGSFKGALGALGSALWGPGGIILGLSVAAELFSKYRESQKTAAETASEFQKAQQGASEGIADELVKSAELYDATQNLNLSHQQRIDAVKELQKLYPAYFGGLTQEAILAGNAKRAYDGLVTSLLNKAAIEGASEPLKQLFKEYSDFKAMQSQIAAGADEMNQKLNLKHPIQNSGFIVDQTTDNLGQKNELMSVSAMEAKFVQRIKDARAAMQSLIQQFGVGSIIPKGDVDRIQEIRQQIKALQLDILNHPENRDADLLNIEKLKKELESLNPSTKKAKEGFAEMEDQIKKITVALQEAIINKQPTVAARLAFDLETAKHKLALLEQSFENSLTFGHGKAALKAQGTNAVGDSQLGQSKSTTGIDHDLDTVMVLANTEAYKDNVNEILRSYYVKKQYDAQTKAENLTLKELTHTIGTGLTQAFQSALSGTQSFVSAMSQFLLQLIEKLIAAAAAAAVLAILLQATGFGSALGLSSGSTGFSSLFGALSGLSGLTGGTSGGGTSTLPTHATGGIFTKPHVGVFAEAGPEAIVTPKQLAAFAGTQGGGFQDGQIVGVLKGADLQLQFLRSAKQKKRLT